jgi:hypothetical protein
MKIKADGNGRWKLVGAPVGTILRRVTITFPSIQSKGPGKTTHHIAGPAKVNIRVQYSNGSDAVIPNVAIEW